MAAEGPASVRDERLATTVSLVTLGLAASIILPLPSGSLTFDVLGSPLNIGLAGTAVLAVIIGAITCTGVDATIRACPTLPMRSLPYTATFWCLPALLTLQSMILIRALAWWGYRVMATAGAALILSLVVSAQCASLEEGRPRFAWTRISLAAGAYLAALALYLILYGARFRSAISASGTLVLSAGLALELYRQTDARLGRVWLYALLTGVTMGELTWALNYTRVNTRVGAAFLLLAFYCVTGLTRQHLWGRLTRRVLLEFGVAAVFGLAMLLLLA
jgi:hypothetical protein